MKNADRSDSPGIRTGILQLTPAQKGSLGESFVLEVVRPTATSVRDLGVAADVRLENGILVDVKMHVRPPRNTSSVTWYWIDYLTHAAEMRGTTSIWAIQPGRPAERTEISSYDNVVVENFFLSWARARRRYQREGRSGVEEGSKQKLLTAARAYFDAKYSVGKNRYLYRVRATATNEVVGPAIYRQREIDRYPQGRTILLIRSKDWTEISAYWVFEHSTPWEKLAPMLSPIPDRPEKYKFAAGAFPLNWRHELRPALRVPTASAARAS